MHVRTWPMPSLRHLRRLTDDCGVLQHAKFWLPDYANGYCVDDNSRALIVASWHYRLFGDTTAHELIVRYLAFIYYVQREDGRICNFIDYSRAYLEQVGSPDSQGRTLWALGHLSTCADLALAIPAREMFHRALPHLTPGAPPHALAYGVLGLCAYAERAEAVDEARRLLAPLAAPLLERYRAGANPEWRWFLPELTYGNARLAEAAMRAGRLLEDATLAGVGLEALDFLNEVCFRDGYLSVVGCHGWYPRGGLCARFDQQPIDAGAMVEANLYAYRTTGRHAYLQRAMTAMDWFFGANIHGIALYDARSGGCYDGLNADGLNANQGAESTVAYLLALLQLYAAIPHHFTPEATSRPHGGVLLP